MTTKRENTAKLDIMDVLRQAGYDIFSAGEEADRVLEEFKQSKRREMTYYVRGSNLSITLTANPIIKSERNDRESNSKE